MERHLLGGQGTLIFLVKYVECSLKIRCYTPELMCQEESVKTFQFF